MNEEYERLNQENKEMNGNSTLPKVTVNNNVMFNPFPLPIQTSLAIDENILNVLLSELPEPNHLIKDQNSSYNFFHFSFIYLIKNFIYIYYILKVFFYFR